MEIKAFVQFLKLLADETRLRIVNILLNREMSVSDLCGVLQINQSTVSKHLVKLRLSGVVTDIRDGSFVYYSLNRENKEFLTIIKLLSKQFSKTDIAGQDIKSTNLV